MMSDLEYKKAMMKGAKAYKERVKKEGPAIFRGKMPASSATKQNKKKRNESQAERGLDYYHCSLFN